MCYKAFFSEFKVMTIIFYGKFPKYSDTQNICCNHSKVWTIWLYHRVMSPNNADGMANSVDSDQTAPREAVWSGSALFAQAYLSENLGSLRYIFLTFIYWSKVLTNQPGWYRFFRKHKIVNNLKRATIKQVIIHLSKLLKFIFRKNHYVTCLV